MALQFDRVAQLSVSHAASKPKLGSGYLVAERLVLTAGHVVDGAAEDAVIDVRFPYVAATATGAVLWSGSAEGLDVAIVELSSPPNGLVRIRAPRVRWGRLTGQRPGVEATGVGFPRALRDSDGTRVPDQVDGAINPGTGFGERYDLKLSGAHPLVSAKDPSPWAGLSGAALFCGDLLVGVVVIDTPNFRSGRLTAVPVWRLLSNAGFTTTCARHGCAGDWESVELADLFERPLGRLDSPASLLRADTAVVGFRGRAQLLVDLRAWCEGPDEVAGMLLVGPGGQGKTRLARELCAMLREGDWVTGFAAGPYGALSPPASRLADSRFPVLVIVDYAETRVQQVRELVAALTDAAGPVRLLLLARSGGEWWQQLRPELRYRLQIGPPIVLAPVEESTEGRGAAYREAVSDLSAALGRLPQTANIDWSATARELSLPDLSSPAYSSILTIHLQALIDLLSADGSNGAGGGTRPEALEDVLLEHEQLYWAQTAVHRGFVEPGYQPVTLKRAVAAATLCGAGDEDEAVATVTRVPGLGDKTSDERRGVARWLADLYPSGETRYWGSLQPDRVGEHLIGNATREKTDLIAAVLDSASEQQQILALTVLARACIHQPHLADTLRELLTTDLSTLGRLAIPVALAAARPRPVVEALQAAANAATKPEELIAVHEALPARTLLLAPLGVDLTIRIAELYRHLAETAPDAYLPLLASSLNNLSVRLAEAGRRAEALAPGEQAVQIYRRLPEAARDAYLSVFAASLHNLSIRLAEARRSPEALAPIEEAVRIRRQLAEALPDAYLPDLAKSLTNLSNRFAEVGRDAEALAPIEEAVGIRRQLAEAQPGTYLPLLATSLNNLSITLAEAKRRTEALTAIEEAVGIRRQLAEAAPDRYLPDLAASLHNLSIRLAEARRSPEALAPIEEAVRIRRQLAEALPDAYLPDLARSLNNLSVGLAEAGRDPEALAAIEEAVQTYRRLAEAQPDAYLPHFAMLLDNLSVRFTKAGRDAEALAAIEEAVQTYRRLAEAQPDAYLAALASSLDSLFVGLAEAGRDPEALAAIEEAVQTYRRRGDALSDAHLPHFATSLDNLSVRLAEAGRDPEALDASEEAVRIRRRVEAPPDAPA